MERMGGAMLSDARPAELSDGALEQALARIEDPASAETPATFDARFEDRPPQLPRFVRSYSFGPWRKLGPVVRTREIMLPEPSATRVLLLESKPGAKVFAHTHGPLEMTCVLSGAFRHRGGRFGPGDFDLAEREVHHAPEIEDVEACLCLVAMQGELRWQGLIGRLLQPFIRL
jgi:putative transcriptional regulator